jgi:hypothetical protein
VRVQRRVALAVCLVAFACAGCGDSAAPSPNPEITPARLSSPGWKVTRRYSVLQALIVEVECRDRERAVEIAKAIVEPVKDNYGEALIYVRPIDKTTTRRVQWRKADGEYRILDF